jgi:hypothetical protein
MRVVAGDPHYFLGGCRRLTIADAIEESHHRCCRCYERQADQAGEGTCLRRDWISAVWSGSQMRAATGPPLSSAVQPPVARPGPGR